MREREGHESPRGDLVDDAIPNATLRRADSKLEGRAGISQHSDLHHSTMSFTFDCRTHRGVFRTLFKILTLFRPYNIIFFSQLMWKKCVQLEM